MATYPIKIFVREQHVDEHTFKVPTTESFTTLKGDEAQKIYEEIINTVPCCQTPKPISVKPTCHGKPKGSEKIRSSSIFLYAQNNDVQFLKQIVQLDKSAVHLTDEYGWTSLMCAACNGSKQAVMLLLKCGADKRKRDKAGNTAVSLAKKNGHRELANFIENYTKPQSLKRKSIPEPYFCPTCLISDSAGNLKHICSTVHLFNDNKSSPLKTFYGIPESNKGFQLLMQNGWDKGTGLGPSGSGRKFPIKAVKKEDRRGIGAPKKQLKTQQSASISFPMVKSRNFERNFRREFI